MKEECDRCNRVSKEWELWAEGTPLSLLRYQVLMYMRQLYLHTPSLKDNPSTLYAHLETLDHLLDQVSYSEKGKEETNE
jgi:hypothetical protein